MMIALLLFAAVAADLPPIQNAATPPAQKPAQTRKQTLLDAVSARMTAPGRAVFQKFVSQTLVPRVRSDAQTAAGYRQSLRALVAAPTLDVDAVATLIDQRKRAEASETASLRTSAFAMIKSLPVADRKLALTAIFAETRLPTAPKPAATPTPVAPQRK